MISLRLNKELYSEQAVAISMASFKDVCGIEKKDEESYHTIVFDCDDKEVVLEFSNYVFSMQKNKQDREASC